MHTIEAAICTVITLILVVQIVLLGQVLYLQTRDIAEQEVTSCVYRVAMSGLYEVADPEHDDSGMPTVRTSPVKLSTLAGAAREALTPVASWLRQVLGSQG